MALPPRAVATLKVLVEVITGFDVQIAQLDVEIRQRARENETARRLMTIPGIGPLIATARDIPSGARLRRLAGSCAATVFNRRQTASWSDDEDGRTVLTCQSAL